MPILIAAFVFTACMFGLGFVAAMWRYRRRALIAEELMGAARGDAAGLSETLRGLQAALAAGTPVEVDSFAPAMPRTEAIFFEAIERDLRRPKPLSVRVRRSIRRAERAASQT